MSTKTIHALYNDDDVLMAAVKKLRQENYEIKEVYTPFPVHGLDKAMGLKRTRIAMAAFAYGCVGISFAAWMMNYMMIENWPQDIGGKPSFSFVQNMPSFVPIMFELTVFCAAHLMVLTFYMRSRIWPFKEAENPDPRTTDDIFLMELEVEEGKENEMTSYLEETGTVEVRIKEKKQTDEK